MRIALVQQAAGPERRGNLQRGLVAARRAAEAGAQLVAFAELAFDRFFPQRRASSGPPLELAEPIPGPTTDAFAALSQELGIVVVLNLYERDGDRAFDSSPVLDRGRLLGTTRMLHIADFEGFHEQGYYTPGDRGVPVYDTSVGKVGVVICYDRHYPEVMRSLGLRGAELVVVPQAGAVGEWPEGLFEAEMRVAAFQNGYYTALVNRVGPEEVLRFGGESFVCSPTGEIIAQAPAGTDHTLLVDIDRGAIERSHARRLFLRDRRPELMPELVDSGGK